MTNTTTLHEFLAKGAEPESLKKLMRHLGMSEINDTPITLLQILDGNGFRDALWALSAIPAFKQVERQVMALWADKYEEDLGDYIFTLRQEKADQSEVDESVDAVKRFIWREVWTNAWDYDWDYEWATSNGSDWPKSVKEQEQQLRDALKGLEAYRD